MSKNISLESDRLRFWLKVMRVTVSGKRVAERERMMRVFRSGWRTAQP